MSDDITPISSGEQTTTGYTVEVRVRHIHHTNPVTLADGIITTKWRTVQFSEGSNPAGVPTLFSRWSPCGGYYSIESATALAWTIIAQHHFRDIECRLVKHRLKHTWSVDKEGEVEGVIKPKSLFDEEDAL